MDAFNRGINAMKESGLITGHGITRNCKVSHLMFIDDVLCARDAKISKWEYFHKMFDKFVNASGLINDTSKTKLITNDDGSEVNQEITSLFWINIRSMLEGFKYLGCFLKPNNPLIQDWEWLVIKLKGKPTCWDH